MEFVWFAVIGIFAVLGLLAWIEQVTRPHVEMHADDQCGEGNTRVDGW